MSRYSLNLRTETYDKHVVRLPTTGRQLIAQYDDNSIIVYQAYRPEIGHFAAQHGYFGGEFSLSRMSWIKPNFLWMMYRSGWGTKSGQEVVLAIRLRRSAFDHMLSLAVHSSFVEAVYGSHAAWKNALSVSSVRLQWDPDHDPSGKKLARRAIQLGLRGEILRRYATEWIIDIQDISDFVAEQRANATRTPYSDLVVPFEDVYALDDMAVATRLGISSS